MNKRNVEDTNCSLVLTFSGIHGSGKSEIIRNLAEFLRKANHSIYVFPSFDYKPFVSLYNNKEGEEFYIDRIVSRNNLLRQIKKLIVGQTFLVDRDLIDTMVYSEYFGFSEFVTKCRNILNSQIGDIHFLIEVDPTIAKERVITRDRKTKREWNEDDFDYLNGIHKIFLKYSTFFDYILENNSTSLQEIVKKILSIITIG